MRPDVHDAALRAAAKVAFSVALLAGCSSTGLGAPATEPTKDGETGSTEKDVISSSPDANKTTPEPGDASADATIHPPPNCENVIASAFGDGGSVDRETPPPELKACCIESLKATVASAVDGGEWLQADFNCCSITHWGKDTGDESNQMAMACTPWGPPVPPTMARRKGMRRRARASSVVGLAA